MTDIDAEVAAFAAQMDGIGSVDEATREADTLALTEAIRHAATNNEAAAAILRFGADRETWPREYRQKVILSAMCSLTLTLTLHSHPLAAAGVASRMMDCALAVHVLGLTESAA